MKSPFDLVGLGLCAWDRLLWFDHYPSSNEKVEAVRSAQSGGGPAPTALCAFTKLGGKGAFIGSVGDDAEGQWIINDLRRFGVYVEYVIIRSECTSPCAYIWVDRSNGQRTVALDRGNALLLQPEELPEAILQTTPYLLIDGRDTEICLRVAQFCRAGGGRVILDAGSPRLNLPELLAVTDHAVVSQDFVKGSFPDLDIETTLKAIAKQGPSSVVITCGERGGIWWENGLMGRYPAFELDVVDTTGAGDVFHGAYCFGLQRGWEMDRRCRFAAAAAALVCRDLGGRNALPTYAEVVSLLQMTT